MSSAYRKPHTCRQHHAALNGGMTYSNRARTTTRRIRIRWLRVAVLLAVVAAIAALGFQVLASSSSMAESPIDVLRSEHRGGGVRELPGAIWPATNQAAVSIVLLFPTRYPARSGLHTVKPRFN
jgi:hypothetical protein